MRRHPGGVNAPRRPRQPYGNRFLSVGRLEWLAAQQMIPMHPITDRNPTSPGSDLPLRGALVESRQRWRDLVSLATDMAFETDADGRFTFVMPDPLFGWPAGALLGQAAERLLARAAGPPGFNPFHAAAPFRAQRAWLTRADGGLACLSFSAVPLLNGRQHGIGTRGVGIDVTAEDDQEGVIAAALRRGAVIDDILWRMRQEVLAPRMMRAVLDGLVKAVGAEGAAVIADGASILHQIGADAGGILATAAELLQEIEEGSSTKVIQAAERPLLVCFCQSRFGERAGLAVWRTAGGRRWDLDDQTLTGSVSSIVRVVLEHDAIQREMARQARTDPLTGMLNRRAFVEELSRHIDRLEREQLPGTLIYADLDNFKAVNDAWGHEIGDRVLCRAAGMLRNMVRPTDLVARLGGDEFAIWLNGADQLTAAERAEWLRMNAPREFAEVIGSMKPTLAFSIGIAMRHSGEEVENVFRRADLAMYEVKHAGRGHWRVAQA